MLVVPLALSHTRWYERTALPPFSGAEEMGVMLITSTVSLEVASLVGAEVGARGTV